MINREVKKESKNKDTFSLPDNDNNKEWRKRGRGNKRGVYRQSRGRGKYNRGKGNKSGFKNNNYGNNNKTTELITDKNTTTEAGEEAEGTAGKEMNTKIIIIKETKIQIII